MKYPYPQNISKRIPKFGRGCPSFRDVEHRHNSVTVVVVRCYPDNPWFVRVLSVTSLGQGEVRVGAIPTWRIIPLIETGSEPGFSCPPTDWMLPLGPKSHLQTSWGWPKGFHFLSISMIPILWFCLAKHSKNSGWDRSCRECKMEVF